MVKDKGALWIAAFIVGWGFDFFYWNKPLGVSFTLHVILALAALLYIARREGALPAQRSLWILGLVLLFSTLAFLRQEPFTRTLNHLMSLGTGFILLLTFQGGRWTSYNLADYVVGFFKLFTNMFILPIHLLDEGEEGKSEHDPQGDPTPASFWRRFLPYLRGFLLALPVIAVFAALLSSADPIFADRLQAVIEALNLEKIPEYISRLVLISIWSFLAAGLMLYALQKSNQEKLIGRDQSWLPRFLGFTETIMVLGGVNLLFFSFVFVQFRYFFGGESNISLQGYTYSEYARRGFGELLAVAFFSLLLFIVLSNITRRETRRAELTFTGLSALLTLFVGVILVSSFQRIRLYEMAYGFTRLRTYSHLCILWIGILFLGILVLEVLRKWRYFTIASLLSVMGFLLTMNVINVDGFIAAQNFKRASEDQSLDTQYLRRLSSDAVPQLVRYADSPWLTPEQEQELGANLACRAAQLKDARKWQGFLWSRYRARRALERHRSLWEEYHTYKINHNWYIRVDGNKRTCRPNLWD